MPTTTMRLPALRLPRLERRQIASSLVLGVVLLLYLVAGLSVTGLGAGDANALVRPASGLPEAVRAAVLPPKPEPLQFRQIAPQDAVALNAAVPLSDEANPAAKAFALNARTNIDRMRSLDCLTQAVYYEAAIEPLEGQRAVAQVVLNRLRHPAYPNTVCGVVYEGSQRATGCQFTFTCDGSLRRTPMASAWQRARKVAEEALAGAVYAPVGWATHYHTNWVVPYWSSSLVKVANVGTHIFYRWTGGWGKAPAFRDRHAGVEPDVNLLRSQAIAKQEAEESAAAVDKLAEAAATAADPTGASAASIDSFQRAILRRYEPATRQGVATTLAAQTRPGETVAAAHRWALTGADAGAKETPLGKKAEPAAAAKPASTAVKPSEPPVLEGVRKAEEPSPPAATRPAE